MINEPLEEITYFQSAWLIAFAAWCMTGNGRGFWLLLFIIIADIAIDAWTDRKQNKDTSEGYYGI